jgi:hypothetical protein
LLEKHPVSTGINDDHVMGMGGSKNGIKTLSGFKANDIKRSSPRMKVELVVAVAAGIASGYFIYSPPLQEVTGKYRNTKQSDAYVETEASGAALVQQSKQDEPAQLIESRD